MIFGVVATKAVVWVMAKVNGDFEKGVEPNIKILRDSSRFCERSKTRAKCCGIEESLRRPTSA